MFESEGSLKQMLGAVLAFLLLLLAYFQWSFSYWKRKGVAHPRASIPFGHVTFRQKNSVMKLFLDCYREYKNKGLKYCGLYFFVEPVLVLIDPDLINAILVRDFHHFVDHGDFANETQEPLTGHLFNLNGSKWKNMRAKLTPTFTSAKMKMMFQILVECTRELLEVMEHAAKNKVAVDIPDVFARLTTDVICSCAFGLEGNSLRNPDSEFRRHGKKMFQRGKIRKFIRHLSLVCPKLLEIFGFKTMDKDASEFFMDIVKRTVDYREKNNVIRKDFMHLLIQLKNNVDIRDTEYTHNMEEKLSDKSSAGKMLTIEEISAQAYVFFVAGFETTSRTLTFFLYELASNIDIQKRLRKEVNDVLKKHHGEVTYDAIMKMHYMEKCIEETLRKYPPATTLIRQCTKAYNVPNSNLVLDKGARVFISVSAIHHDAEYYPEPEKFDPERFSPENKAKRHPSAWLPFGEGPRRCIGVRFAMMEIKVALTVLLQNYKFTLNDKTRTVQVLNFATGFLGANEEVWLNVEKIAV